MCADIDTGLSYDDMFFKRLDSPFVFERVFLFPCRRRQARLSSVTDWRRFRKPLDGCGHILGGDTDGLFFYFEGR